MSEVREGNPALCIAAEAVLESDTLVAMSSHGRSGISRWMLGSVTDKVLHGIETPLLAGRAREGAASWSPVDVRDLIVPQDGSTMAEQSLPHVSALARAFSATVRLVRANPVLGGYRKYMELHRQDNLASLYSETFHEVSNEADARAMDHLLDVKNRLRSMGTTLVEENLVKGDAPDVIIDLARDTANCMVVMSWHGRSGMGRWVLASVSDRTVRHSGVPVLIIRATEDGVNERDAES